MKNRVLIFITPIILLGIVVSFYFVTKHKPIKKSVVINSEGGQLSQFTLSDICHCYAVTGSMGIDSMYDTKSLQQIPSEMLPSGGTYFDTSLSPSHKAIIAIKDHAVWYQSRPGLTAKKVYTSGIDETIGMPQWSTDEQYIVIGVQLPADQQPAEGLWASALRRIRLSDGQTTTIITREQSLKQGMKNLFAFAASNNGQTVWFSSGGMYDQRLFTWTSAKGVSELQNVYYSSIYTGTTEVDGKGVFLSVQGGTLHQYDINANTDRVLTLTLQGDSPVSIPSPDGGHLIVLLHSQTDAFGIPAIYNLSTGGLVLLTDTPLTVPTGLSGLVWSPDSSSIVYGDGDYPNVKYFYLRTTVEHQTPQFISKLPTSESSPILYALLPRQSVQDVQIVLAQDATSMLDDLKESHATQQQAKKILADVQNTTLYTKNLTDSVGGTDCGVSKRNSELQQLNAEGVRTQEVNGGLTVALTSNSVHWVEQDLSDFGWDQTVVCGVGTSTPQVLLNNGILWWEGCYGGVGITKENNPDYQRQVRCLQAQEVVNTYFGNLP